MSKADGKGKRTQSTSNRSVPPTLKPYLDNLPRPLVLGSTEHTPGSHEHTEQTPRQPQFPMLSRDEDGEEDTDEQQKEDKIGDDEEFESHYSRHSSSQGSEDEDEDEGAGAGAGPDADADADANADPGASDTTPTSQVDGDGENHPVQRINSMPTTAPRFASEPPLRPTIHTSRSTTALSRAAPPIPTPFYPPLYNKPRTPVQPSPSLTSLLPLPSLLNRSTTSTRPTTPDSSDPETPNDTEAAVAHSARRAKPVPSTSPKVPTYEYYGFVLYLASSLAFLIYILWAYLPSPFLHALGITYYPNRWWALAIPGWIVMALCYVYVALACWNVEYLTLGLEQVECMVDEAGSVAVLDESGRVRRGGSKWWVNELENRWREEQRRGWRGGGRHKKEVRTERADDYYGYMGEITETGVASGLSWGQIWNEGTDAVIDVPIGGVCEVLYGEGRDHL